MTTFKNTITIHKDQAAVYSFLADMNNHEQLMPDDVENWSSTEDQARFTIKNMIKLALTISERIAPQEIVCVPLEEAPFALTLRWQLESVGEDETNATFLIEAELNMMMKMVASGPLQKLVDHQVQTLQQIVG